MFVTFVGEEKITTKFVLMALLARQIYSNHVRMAQLPDGLRDGR